jgi:hypothetical protein
MRGKPAHADDGTDKRCLRVASNRRKEATPMADETTLREEDVRTESWSDTRAEVADVDGDDQDGTDSDTDDTDSDSDGTDS